MQTQKAHTFLAVHFSGKLQVQFFEENTVENVGCASS